LPERISISPNLSAEISWGLGPELTHTGSAGEAWVLRPIKEEQDISVGDKSVFGAMNSDFALAEPLFGLRNIEGDTSVLLLKTLKQRKHLSEH
jgi:hypothetical protein